MVGSYSGYMNNVVTGYRRLTQLVVFLMFWVFLLGMEFQREERNDYQTKSSDKEHHHKSPSSLSLHQNISQTDKKTILQRKPHQNTSPSSLPLYQNISQTDKKSILQRKPWEIVEQYIEWHSVEALRRQPENRSFAIGYYSCPLQAGNRLHHFFNSLLWSILTNRTLLWQYWDKPTCLQQNKYYDKGICKSANKERGCNAVLERSSWIPSFQEWSTRLDLPSEPHQYHYWSTFLNTSRGKPVRDRGFQPGDEKHTGVDTDAKHPIVAFPQMLGEDGVVLAVQENLDYLLHTEWSRSIAKVLLDFGADFLYGMLFRNSFQFTDKILGPSREKDAESDYFSVALHSRHVKENDKGCSIKQEKKCLNEVLSHRRKKQPCQVYVMSDRSCTLFKLSEWLDSKNCTVEIANHKLGISWRYEHGPFAGIGYFQDLALASKARSGFVGSGRSSSSLLSELIEYDRRMEAFRAFGNTTKVSKLHKCKIE